MRNARIIPAMAARLALGAAFLTLAAAPALAQIEELTVTGRRPDKEARSLSYPVTFRDLDLTTPGGRKELNRRIRITATYLCNKLGENDSNMPITSCRTAAISDAMVQAGKAAHQARAHGAHWAPGPAWVPPGAP